jgi:Sec-independent protein translocase protein TatA
MGDVAKGIKSFKKGMSTDISDETSISDDTSTDVKDNADSKNISNDNTDSEQK